MSKLKINVKVKNLPQIKEAFSTAPKEMSRELKMGIRKSVDLLERRSQAKVPVKTGELKGSSYRKLGNLRGEFGYTAKHAIFVHEGTRSHIILPHTNGGALYWEGASHPVSRVNHPGTAANPFLRKATHNSEKEIRRIMTKSVDNVMEGISRRSG